jgi:Crinkler effector protein N-terminal domain
MSITLLCLVKGNTTVNAFPVDIDKDQLVGHLKDAIKAKKAPEFDNFPADRLKLWKVSIPGDHYDQLKNLSLQEQDELLAINDIGEYWPTSPPKKHIHVIVEQPPATTATSNREQELLEENASLKEKLSKSEYGTYKFLYLIWIRRRAVAEILGYENHLLTQLLHYRVRRP